MAKAFNPFRISGAIRFRFRRKGGLTSAPLVKWDGVLAPDLTIKALDGTNWTLSALKGKRVVLDFWATWPSVFEGDSAFPKTSRRPAEPGPRRYKVIYPFSSCLSHTVPTSVRKTPAKRRPVSCGAQRPRKRHQGSAGARCGSVHHESRRRYTADVRPPPKAR